MTTVIATPTAIYGDSYCATAPSFSTDKVQHVVSSKIPNVDYLVGGAGDLAEVTFMIELLRHYCLENLWTLQMQEHWPPDIMIEGGSELLVVTRSKEIWIIDYRMVPMQLHDKFYCIGSGAPYATAAMKLGKDPVDAIQLASELDENTRGPIDMVEFPDG